jgi:membrane complex biogenesis BtpA family protein
MANPGSRRAVFHQPHAVIGMVHVAALPGTPRASDPVGAIMQTAAGEARQLADGGADAVMIENMHDVPYQMRNVGAEITAAMTAVGCAVRQAVNLPLGVQILAGANKQSLAVAHACGADFIRVEGFVYAHVADEGLMPDADAGDLLRYRRAIGATDVAVWADIKKKHSSHAITADVDLAETAATAEFFGADALVVTGAATGQPTRPADLQRAKQAVNVPIVVGSGTSPDNLESLWPYADAFIVGSFIKRDGLWSNPPDPARLKRFMDRVTSLRGAR